MFDDLEALVRKGHKEKEIELIDNIVLKLKTLSHAETSEATSEASKNGGNLFNIMTQTLLRSIVEINGKTVNKKEHKEKLLEILNKIPSEMLAQIYDQYLDLTRSIEKIIKNDEVGSESVGKSTTQY